MRFSRGSTLKLWLLVLSLAATNVTSFSFMSNINNGYRTTNKVEALTPVSMVATNEIGEEAMIGGIRRKRTKEVRNCPVQIA